MQPYSRARPTSLNWPILLSLGPLKPMYLDYITSLSSVSPEKEKKSSVRRRQYWTVSRSIRYGTSLLRVLLTQL